MPAGRTGWPLCLRSPRGGVVECRHGEDLYGPYTVTLDPAAVPEGEQIPINLTGVEVRRGDEVIFRGGCYEDSFLMLWDENGTIHSQFSDGIAASKSDPSEPKVTELLQLVLAPEEDVYKRQGYDQAFLLASAAAEALGEKAVATLRKARHNRAQSGLGEDAARRANVIAAYEVLDREAVRGRRVLLIDDIVTTGATLSECARTLLAAGAKEVVCAAAARAR